ncbi:unnamed protein product [Brachionus calyciflorus]|uniref:Shisa N-terminal domain-containing protein n=1 Tax=Brachionus calyciflorus TaxID=104777 RepID=A0A814J5Z2_9BILA|nr:unnamed protein product [Brachionus calyciflorus]
MSLIKMILSFNQFNNSISKIRYEICEGFTENGNVIQPQLCLEPEPYCCGSCFDRFCCSSESMALNQLTCKPKSTTTTSTKNSYLYNYETDLNVFWLLLLVALLIFIFFCIIVVIGKRNKYKMRRLRELDLTSQYVSRRNIPLVIRTAMTSDNGQSRLSSTNASQLFQQDLPPPYDSLELKSTNS